MNERELIDKYLGTPFKWGGRTPGVAGGLDCWTFVAAAMADLGRKVWEIDGTEYPAGPEASHNHFIEHYHRQWDEVTDPRPFDVVLMKDLRGNAGHVGLVLSNGRIIHCPKAGVVVTRAEDPGWSPRILGYYRFKA